MSFAENWRSVPYLLYADAGPLVDWYQRVLGFVELRVTRTGRAT